MRLLIPLIVFILFSCGNKKIEPHDYYLSKEYDGFSYLVIDFYGFETIRIFGEKNGRFVLSFGKWERIDGDKVRLLATESEVGKTWFESASNLAQQISPKNHSTYKTENLTLRLDVLSQTELEETETKAKFTQYDF